MNKDLLRFLPGRGIWLVVALAFVGSIWFLYLISVVRFAEMDRTMDSVAEQQSTWRLMSMLAKYKRLSQEIADNSVEADFRNEAMLAFSLRQTLNSALLQKSTAIRRASHAAVSGLNWLLTGSVIPTIDGSGQEAVMEASYYLELRRHYRTAAAYNSDVINTATRGSDIWFHALLHRAFCFALISAIDYAKTDIQTVLDSAPKQELRYVAWALNQLISQNETEILALTRVTNELHRATAYFRLAAYPKALSLYERLPKPQRNSKTKYYQARSHEELGEDVKALELYRRIIQEDAQSIWASRANQRLYLMGVAYVFSQSLADEARENARLNRKLGQNLIKRLEHQRLLFEKFAEKNKEIETILSGLQPSSKAGLVSLDEPLNMPLDMKGAEAVHDRRLLRPSVTRINKHKNTPLQIEKVILTDGNVLVGSITLETANKLTISTPVGNIVVAKREIRSRSTLYGKSPPG